MGDHTLNASHFWLRLSCVTMVNVLVATLWLATGSWSAGRHTWTHAQTESVLLPMPRGERVGLVILGTSHGRNFSRFGNHARVERILGTRVVNLSRGFGNGLLPARVNLETFFSERNTTDAIVYYVDPWALFSPTWNEENPYYFAHEPFEFHLLARSILVGVKPGIWWNYVRQGFDPHWFSVRPEHKPDIENRQAVTEVLPDLVKKRLAVLYDRGLDHRHLQRYARHLEAIVEMARARAIPIGLMLYPTLLGEEPGLAQVKQLLEKLATRSGVRVVDHRFAIQSPGDFEDLDHLNTPGTVAYAEHYLQQVVSDLRNQSLVSSR